MSIITQLDLSRSDLVLLSEACWAAGFYYEEFVRPRLRERDLEMLESLGYQPAEGEEEAEFINALERISFDIRELYLLEVRLNEEIKKLPATLEE
jgi:hypothetical protein